MSETLLQDALRLRRAGRLAEAAEIYAGILRSEPKHFEALHALGILRYQRGELEEAERLIGEAVALRPGAADACYNRGCLQQKLNRPDAALRSFDAAIALKPGYAEALTNRGTVLMGLRRYREALADFDKVRALKPNLPQAWNNRAGALLKLNRHAEAIASADRALAIHPGFADAWWTRGAALLGERRFAEALEALDRAVAIDPGSAGAWESRGHALAELGRIEDAIAAYDRALGMKPGSADALYHRGNAHFAAKRFADAARDYRAALEIDPEYKFARGALVFSTLACCDWRSLESDRAAALAELRAGKPAVAPFECLAFSDTPADGLAAARIWLAQQPFAALPPLSPGERYAHERIRVAYLSADFHAHATAALMAGVFERHDRNRFETSAISFGPDDGSELRGRLARAFDRFVDVRDRSDSDVASMLRDMEIDIAVDLKGYTQHARPGILAHRPAPVQVHYLGYPATTGAKFIDYVLADSIVIPEEEQRHYSERVVYLPDSYQCNDSLRRVAGRTPSRAEAGLPDSGFVYCSFNNTYKLTPEMFSLWMRLLRAVAGSVLWLYEDNPAAARNLRSEAEARGVASGRLVFAPRKNLDEHLARHRLADLFLDTLPCGAHTTASDALWTGLPVLSCMGSTFAGRVAASLLHAIGLPELVAGTPGEYETLALRLARDGSMLSALKTKLVRNRDIYPLFDTARIARHLESAYATMWERVRRGEAPAGFAVEAGGRRA